MYCEPLIFIGIESENPSCNDKPSSSNYNTGTILESDKEWYHGEITRDEAEKALKASGCDCFLVRHCQGILVLSLIHDGGFHHITINYGPGWYELENGSTQYSFTELEDLVAYYLQYSISPELAMSLGKVCMERVQKRGEDFLLIVASTRDSSFALCAWPHYVPKI